MADESGTDEIPLEDRDSLASSNGAEDDGLPLWMVLWGGLVHTGLSSLYFVLISCIAIGIDLGLRWFERRPFVMHYGLNPIIRWEIEFMAISLAFVDCLLFMRFIIKPVVEWIQAARSRGQ